MVQFAACKDSQAAEDKQSVSGGRHTGAATFLFVRACERLLDQQQPLTCAPRCVRADSNTRAALTLLHMLTVLWRPRRYVAIIKDMLKPFKELSQEGCSSGRGGSATSGLAIAAADAASEVAGGRGSGQTPQLSASEPFDLRMEMVL